MRYRVSEDAERDLDEIFLYWAARASLEAADRVVDRITERFWLLGEHPDAGKPAREIAAGVAPGSRVAAVSHAGAISFYLTHLLRLDSGPLRVLPRFTSVTVLLIKDDRIVVQSIGDVAHLAGEPVTG